MKPIVIDIKTKRNGKYQETVILKQTTLEQTLELIQQRLSIEEIARLRGLTTGTIEGHVCQLIEKRLVSPIRFIPVHVKEEVENLIKNNPGVSTGELIVQYPQYSFFDFRIVRTDMQKS